MKIIILVVVYFLSNLHTVYTSSWSMVICEENSVARKCSKYISKLSKKEGATFFVSGSSRRHFSLDYEGSCSTFEEELVKLKNCDSCKIAYNSHENISDCVEMEETRPKQLEEPNKIKPDEIVREGQSRAEAEVQTEAQSEKQKEAQMEAQPDAQLEARQSKSITRSIAKTTQQNKGTPSNSSPDYGD